MSSKLSSFTLFYDNFLIEFLFSWCYTYSSIKNKKKERIPTINLQSIKKLLYFVGLIGLLKVAFSAFNLIFPGILRLILFHICWRSKNTMACPMFFEGDFFGGAWAMCRFEPASRFLVGAHKAGSLAPNGPVICHSIFFHGISIWATPLTTISPTFYHRSWSWQAANHWNHSYVFLTFRLGLPIFNIGGIHEFVFAGETHDLRLVLLHVF